MPKTVGVAVSNATFHFDKLYTYAVMPDQQNAVKLGSMVLVPFGRGSRARMGVVLACDAEPESAKLKYLFDVAPASACLTPELLRLVHFLKERTFCTYYEAVKAVIPYGAQYKPAVAADGVTPVLQKQLTRHTENSYRLVGGLPPKPKPTAKQLAAVALLGGGPRTLNELEDKGISRAVLDNLCAKGVLECSKVNKSIDLYSSIPLKNEPITLTQEQQAAYDALLPKLEDDAPHSALLYGVTGSGKTLVFLKLIARCLEQGRRALVLVPEISLTPQMILRLKSQFGRRVAVQHSALNHTERLLQWQMIQDGGADIVVGTRSAIFSPLENIGLIIIDEEQEHTYRSESAPRYSAHEVARQRAAENGALLLLASATVPAIYLFFKNYDQLGDTLKNKYAIIEDEIPQFIRSIESGLHTDRDIIRVLERYNRIASPAMRSELEVLLADMQTSNVQRALMRFDNRMNSAEISRLVAALIEIDRGTDATMTLQYLAQDMTTLHRSLIQKELDKRPGQMRRAILPSGVILVVMMFYIMIMAVVTSASSLF